MKTEINCPRMVLGNGLSAKIWCLFNPEYRIVGKNSTKESSSKNALVFLHKNYWNGFLLDCLNIEKKIKQADVYVVQNVKENILRGAGVIGDELRKSVILEKLTDENGYTLPYYDRIFKRNDSLSCSDKTLLEFYDIDMSYLERLLAEMTRPNVLVCENAESIDTEKKIVETESYTIKYESLVSTVPANIFEKLCGGDIGKYRTMSTAILPVDEHNLPKNIWNMLKKMKNAIVYFPGTHYPKIVVRDYDMFSERTVSNSYAPVDGEEVMRFTRLVRERVKRRKGIVHLGRYAEWNPDIRVQDIVRTSASKTVLHDMFSEQEAFSARYFDFVEDEAKLQENIKEIALLMQDEVFSLLGEINWKKHRQAKEQLNFEKIKEEWIDIFKYWLTMGINLGMTPEDFVDAFKKKGEKLEEKYGKS